MLGIIKKWWDRLKRKHKPSLWEYIICILITIEAGFFARFFIPITMRTGEYWYVSVINLFVHLLVLYPIAVKFFLHKGN
jgi:hypothetical protein